MPRSSKAQSKPGRARRQAGNKNEVRISKFLPIGLVRLKLSAQERRRSFLSRRPHRSFRPTRRRDYSRSLKMPGYWAFTTEVVRVLQRNWRSLLWLSLIYALLSTAFLGLSSQEGFSELRSSLSETGAYLLGGEWSELGQASVLALVTLLGAVSPELSVEQQMYAIFFGLLVWLTTVWLLRHRLAGHNVKLRDALYSAGSPIVAMIVLLVIAVVQLLPVALAVIMFSAAQQTGLLSGGVEAMLFWAAAVGLGSLSAYWLSGTAFAAIIATNPGTYPLQAVRVGGDMVAGRRLRILLRLLWLGFINAALWVIVLTPAIIFDAWLKDTWESTEGLPIVPAVFMVVGSVALTTSAAYIYLLYRKVVNDDAAPA